MPGFCDCILVRPPDWSSFTRCALCDHVLDSPKVCPFDDKHVFCSSCIRLAVSEFGQCPVDRSTVSITSFKKFKYIESIIHSHLHFKCPFCSSSSTEWSLSGLERHISNYHSCDRKLSDLHMNGCPNEARTEEDFRRAVRKKQSFNLRNTNNIEINSPIETLPEPHSHPWKLSDSKIKIGGYLVNLTDILDECKWPIHLSPVHFTKKLQTALDESKLSEDQSESKDPEDITDVDHKSSRLTPILFSKVATLIESVLEELGAPSDVCKSLSEQSSQFNKSYTSDDVHLPQYIENNDNVKGNKSNNFNSMHRIINESNLDIRRLSMTSLGASVRVPYDHYGAHDTSNDINKRLNSEGNILDPIVPVPLIVEQAEIDKQFKNGAIQIATSLFSQRSSNLSNFDNKHQHAEEDAPTLTYKRDDNSFYHNEIKDNDSSRISAKYNVESPRNELSVMNGSQHFSNYKNNFALPSSPQLLFNEENGADEIFNNSPKLTNNHRLLSNGLNDLEPKIQEVVQEAVTNNSSPLFLEDEKRTAHMNQQSNHTVAWSMSFDDIFKKQSSTSRASKNHTSSENIPYCPSVPSLAPPGFELRHNHASLACTLKTPKAPAARALVTSIFSPTRTVRSITDPFGTVRRVVKDNRASLTFLSNLVWQKVGIGQKVPCGAVLIDADYVQALIKNEMNSRERHTEIRNLKSDVAADKYKKQRMLMHPVYKHRGDREGKDWTEILLPGEAKAILEYEEETAEGVRRRLRRDGDVANASNTSAIPVKVNHLSPEDRARMEDLTSHSVRDRRRNELGDLLSPEEVARQEGGLRCLARTIGEIDFGLNDWVRQEKDLKKCGGMLPANPVSRVHGLAGGSSLLAEGGGVWHSPTRTIVMKRKAKDNLSPKSNEWKSNFNHASDEDTETKYIHQYDDRSPAEQRQLNSNLGIVFEEGDASNLTDIDPDWARYLNTLKPADHDANNDSVEEEMNARENDSWATSNMNESQVSSGSPSDWKTMKNGIFSEEVDVMTSRYQSQHNRSQLGSNLSNSESIHIEKPVSLNDSDTKKNLSSVSENYLPDNNNSTNSKEHVLSLPPSAFPAPPPLPSLEKRLLVHRMEGYAEYERSMKAERILHQGFDYFNSLPSFLLPPKGFQAAGSLPPSKTPSPKKIPAQSNPLSPSKSTASPVSRANILRALRVSPSITKVRTRTPSPQRIVRDTSPMDINPQRAPPAPFSTPPPSLRTASGPAPHAPPRQLPRNCSSCGNQEAFPTELCGSQRMILGVLPGLHPTFSNSSEISDKSHNELWRLCSIGIDSSGVISHLRKRSCCCEAPMWIDSMDNVEPDLVAIMSGKPATEKHSPNDRLLYLSSRDSLKKSFPHLFNEKGEEGWVWVAVSKSDLRRQTLEERIKAATEASKKIVYGCVGVDTLSPHPASKFQRSQSPIDNCSPTRSFAADRRQAAASPSGRSRVTVSSAELMKYLSRD